MTKRKLDEIEVKRDYTNAKAFTLAQLKQDKGTLISIGCEVYDVSKFTYRHPGGEAILEHNRGEEVDHILEDPNHRNIYKILNGDKIKWLGILLDGKAEPKNASLRDEIRYRLTKNSTRALDAKRAEPLKPTWRAGLKNLLFGYETKKPVLVDQSIELSA